MWLYVSISVWLQDAELQKKEASHSHMNTPYPTATLASIRLSTKYYATLLLVDTNPGLFEVYFNDSVSYEIRPYSHVIIR